MRKHVYLHIGFHKTGSTAIQQFLARNRAALRHQGILYPGETADHNKCVAKFHAHQQQSSGMSKRLAALKAEIDQSNEHTVILSAEAMQSQITPYLKQFRHWLGDQHQYTVIVYIRRWDHYLVSRYNQRVKHPDAAITQTLREYIAQADEHILGMRDSLYAWAHFFGQANIKLIPYESYGKSDRHWLLKDFCRAVGIQQNQTLQFVSKEANRKLSDQALGRVRQWNRIPASRSLRKRLTRLAIVSAKYWPSKLPQSMQISQEDRQRLLSRYQSIEQQLADDFLSNQTKVWKEPWTK